MTWQSDDYDSGDPDPEADLGFDPEQLAEDLASQAALLAQLATRISDIEKHIADSSAGGPWGWRYLDAKHQAMLAEELRDWVDWFIPRYQIREIPSCWYRHTALLEELTALFVAWKEAYSPLTEKPNEKLIAWHDRWLHPWRLRTGTQYVTSCQHGHKDDLVPANKTDLLDFEDWLGQEKKQRPEALERDQIMEHLQEGEALALIRTEGSPVLLNRRWWAPLAGTPQNETPQWTARDQSTGRRLTQLMGRSPVDPRTGEVRKMTDPDAWEETAVLASQGMRLMPVPREPTVR